MKHIILDTDIGGDPDDAFTTLLALNSPELSLDLIITNDEHRGDRARFTKRWLSIMGKKTDVAAGTDLGNDRCFVIGKLIGKNKTRVSSDFLQKAATSVKRNKTTWWVCIGPQSNLARFIKKHPSLKSKVKILIMGGRFFPEDKAEHNIRYDARAAKAVFMSDWEKRYVFADITHNDKIKIDKKSPFYKRLAKIKKEHIRLLVKSMDPFFKRLFPQTFMHDPLTLSWLIDPKIISFSKKKLKMDMTGVITESKTGKTTTVSQKADYARFMRLFEKRILESK
jgi:inosine-uridine nucleoside N-ribohydrolase